MEIIFVFIMLFNFLIAENSIDIGFKSFHFSKDKNYDFNETNPGIFFTYENLFLGYVNKNSYNDESYMLAYTEDFLKRKDFLITFKAGGITGYDGYIENTDLKKGTDGLTLNGVMPFIGIDLKYKFFKLAILPSLNDPRYSVLYTGISINY